LGCGNPLESPIPDHSPHHRTIFLLDPRLVIFPIGTTPRQFNPVTEAVFDQGLVDKLAAIVGSDIAGWPARDEQLGECCQHVLMAEPAGNDKCQALAARLHHSKLSAS